MSTIPKTVKRGAALLDARKPGWEKKIELFRLDLGHCDRCVLGQLHSRAAEPFERGRSVLGLNDFEASRHGFMVHGPGSYENLTDAWYRLILKRRQEGTA